MGIKDFREAIGTGDIEKLKRFTETIREENYISNVEAVGILGGAGAAAATGATIGSMIFPFVGTIFGGVVGAVATFEIGAPIGLAIRDTVFRDVTVYRNFRFDSITIGDDKLTPLTYVADKGYYEIAEYLLTHPKYFSLQHSRGGINEAFVVSLNKNDSMLAKLFMEKGAHINLQYDNKNTTLINYIKVGNIEAAKFLIENGADVTMEGEHGYTALSWALKTENIALEGLIGSKLTERMNTEKTSPKADESKMYLNELNSYVDYSTSENRMSQLMYACINGDCDLVSKLVNLGADVNARDNIGYTPLFHTTSKRALYKQSGYKGTYTEFERTKESQEFKKIEGKVEFAKKSNMGSIIELLVSNGARHVSEISLMEKIIALKKAPVLGLTCDLLLHQAVKKGNINEVRRALEMPNVSIDIPDAYGYPAVAYAFMGGHSEIVNLLIEKGATISKNVLNGKKTLLMVAIENNNEDLFDRVLAYLKAIWMIFAEIKEELDKADLNQKTVLMYALESGNARFVRELIANGAYYIPEVLYCVDPDGCGDNSYGHAALVLVNRYWQNSETKREEGKLYDYAYAHGQAPSSKITKVTGKLNSADIVENALILFKEATAKKEHCEVKETKCYTKRVHYILVDEGGPSDGRTALSFENLKLEDLKRGAEIAKAAKRMLEYSEKSRLSYNYMGLRGIYKDTYNCTTILREVLSKGGIEIPNFMIPTEVFKELVRQNEGTSQDKIRFYDASVQLQPRMSNPQSSRGLEI